MTTEADQAFSSPFEPPYEPLGSTEISDETRASLALKEIKERERPGKYYPKLLELYGSVGIGAMFLNKRVARTILVQAEDCARSVDKLARENKQVARVVEFLTGSSALTGVIIAHAPIGVALYREFTPTEYQERVGAFLAQGLRAEESNGDGQSA